VLTQARRELEEYFRGERRSFDVPLDQVGSTFQKTVWDALMAIPYGATASYGEVADLIGKPGAARAVGGANGRNPIPIIVPCHRVIGASGALTGYGGPGEAGIEMKRWLIGHEDRAQPSQAVS
jgi:methylated-DNA-[protein]-cysteine S-methyltransferase